MIYQVRANLYFVKPDEARDFYHDCVLAFAKSTIVNPDSVNTEHSTLEQIENHHDEDPNGPCWLMAHITTADQ